MTKTDQEKMIRFLTESNSTKHLPVRRVWYLEALACHVFFYSRLFCVDLVGASVLDTARSLKRLGEVLTFPDVPRFPDAGNK